MIWRILSFIFVLGGIGISTDARALPRMISYRYWNCVACHDNPQGAGIMNADGQEIDRAQSFFSGPGQQFDRKLYAFLTANGRAIQDVRFIGTVSQPGTGPSSIKNEFMYRNVFQITKQVRTSLVVDATPKPYSAPAIPYPVYYKTPKTNGFALTRGQAYYRFHEAAGEGREVAAGRDYLPDGLNNANEFAFVRDRNRLGFSDVPWVIKGNIWTKTFQFQPYVFFPTSLENVNQAESGVGMLYERALDPSKNKYGEVGARSVLGGSLIFGTSHVEKRETGLLHFRAGPRPDMGVLVEGGLTNRQVIAPLVASFWQTASYFQFYWTPHQWLNATASLETLNVADPFPETAYREELALTARWSPNVTTKLSAALCSSTATSNCSLFAFFLYLKTGAIKVP